MRVAPDNNSGSEISPLPLQGTHFGGGPLDTLRRQVGVTTLPAKLFTCFWTPT